MKSPFELNNIRQFIAFGVFFNARFYYSDNTWVMQGIISSS